MTKNQPKTLNKLPKKCLSIILNYGKVITESVTTWASFSVGLGASLVIIQPNPAAAQRVTLESATLLPLPHYYASHNLSKTHPPQRKEELADNSSKAREYDFERATRANSAFKYRVEVYGNSDSLLRLVKQIEPTAFRKGKVIQAGIFGEQQKAEEQVLRLTSQGVWARIVIINNAPKKAGSR